MNRVIAGALLGLLVVAASPCSAQDLEAKYKAKLAEGWIKSPAWITDYDAARKAAKEQGKVIFAYFTRSYSF